MKNRLLSAQDAAAELGVSKRRVLALISAGRLSATKIGSQYVIEPSDLEAVRERRAGRPAHPEPTPAALAQRRSRERRKG